VPEPEGWQRLHPFSPFLLAGRYVIVFVFGAVQSFGAELVENVSGLALVLRLLGGLVAVTFVASVYSWLAWRMRGYRVTPERVEQRSGVVFRSFRHLPLVRIESVDTAQPLLPRLFGLAEVRIEAISQGDTELKLRYLSLAEAERLREELAARRGQRVVAEEHPVLPPEERLVLQVPARELAIGYLAIPAALIVPIVAVALLVLLISSRSVVAPIVGLLVAGAGIVPTLATRLERIWDFRVEDSGEALVINRGLLNLSTQRIATGRIQAVRIEQPPLWRAFRRYRVVVDVAGYRGASSQEGAAAANLLPVAPAEAVRYLLDRLEMRLDLAQLDLRPPPERARWRAPVRWRCWKVATTATHTITASGLLWRQTSIVPHAKVQSARITQGPWQRWLGLASLHLDTAGARIVGVAEHRDALDAGAIAERRVVSDPSR
jgi:putative membrane protein